MRTPTVYLTCLFIFLSIVADASADERQSAHLDVSLGAVESKNSQAFIRQYSQHLQASPHVGLNRAENCEKARKLKLALSNRKGLTVSASHTVDGHPIRGSVQPLGSMVLVKPREVAEKSTGGVLLPSAALEQQIVGQVLAVGPGDVNPITGKKSEIPTKVGDWVLFGRNEFQELKYDGERHGFIPSDSIFATLSDTDNGQTSPDHLCPLQDNILVKISSGDSKTSGGLLLSRTEKTTNTMDGVVVAAGSGKKDSAGKPIPIEIAPGDTVRFNTYAVSDGEFKLGQARYAFIRASDAIAKWS